MQRTSFEMQVAYSGLLEKCIDDDMQNVTEPSGFTSKLIKGKRYWYSQKTNENGKQTQSYLGVETYELLHEIEHAKELRQHFDNRREVVKSLKLGAGFKSPSAKLCKAINTKAILSGTAAFQTYLPMLGIKAGKPALLDANEGISYAEEDDIFTEFLIKDEIKAIVLHGPGILVRVPDPTRFAIYLLLTGTTDKEYKQAEILLSVLIEDRPYDVQDYWNEMADAWKILAKSTAEEKFSKKISTFFLATFLNTRSPFLSLG